MTTKIITHKKTYSDLRLFNHESSALTAELSPIPNNLLARTWDKAKCQRTLCRSFASPSWLASENTPSSRILMLGSGSFSSRLADTSWHPRTSNCRRLLLLHRNLHTEKYFNELLIHSNLCRHIFNESLMSRNLCRQIQSMNGWCIGIYADRNS